MKNTKLKNFKDNVVTTITVVLSILVICEVGYLWMAYSHHKDQPLNYSGQPEEWIEEEQDFFRPEYKNEWTIYDDFVGPVREFFEDELGYFDDFYNFDSEFDFWDENGFYDFELNDSFYQGTIDDFYTGSWDIPELPENNKLPVEKPKENVEPPKDNVKPPNDKGDSLKENELPNKSEEPPKEIPAENESGITITLLCLIADEESGEGATFMDDKELAECLNQNGIGNSLVLTGNVPSILSSYEYEQSSCRLTRGVDDKKYIFSEWLKNNVPHQIIFEVCDNGRSIKAVTEIIDSLDKYICGGEIDIPGRLFLVVSEEDKNISNDENTLG